MVRARMSELLAPSMSASRDRAFTTGLFSLLDAMTGRPMAELVTELPFDDRLAEALLDHTGPEGKVLLATLAYERGDFDEAASSRPPRCSRTPTSRRSSGATTKLPRSTDPPGAPRRRAAGTTT